MRVDERRCHQWTKVGMDPERRQRPVQSAFLYFTPNPEGGVKKQVGFHRSISGSPPVIKCNPLSQLFVLVILFQTASEQNSSTKNICVQERTGLACSC